MSAFDAPQWFDALTLSERAASLGESGITDFDRIRGEKMLARWRGQVPFGNDSVLTERLLLERLSLEQFVCLLGESSSSLRRRVGGRPAWLDEIAAAFGRSGAREHDREFTSNLISNGLLFDEARRRLRDRVATLARSRRFLPFRPSSIDQFFLPHLSQHISRITTRTMVLELHVARLQGLLTGETPQERFKSFAERLRRPKALLSLFEEYPVLARQIVLSANQWVAVTGEFLARLCDDWEEICARIPEAREAGSLAAVSSGAGDTHRNGRSVLIATFDNGFRLVYKPRSLRVDIHYGELLDWLNERGNHPEFRILRIVDRGTHGWTEFVENRSCQTEEEIERFYQRQGGFIALLYVLEATDFHLENLIACGEHPLLIDLEALFHPRAGFDSPGEAAALTIMSHSVLRSGLLPQRMWVGTAGAGVDLSGLGGSPGQLTPFDVPALDSVGTDEMRVVRKQVPLPGGQNRPTLNGAGVDARNYVESINRGFVSLYQTIRKHQDLLLAPDGPLAQFAEDEVRVVLRPTQTYGALLAESFHPDLLRNALDRDRLFDLLWVETERRPSLARVIPAEQRDLLQGDIPLFYTLPGSRDLFTSTAERLAGFFEAPSLEMARRRILALDEDDLARQSWFIRASMTTLRTGNDQWKGYRPASSCSPAGRDELIGAACRVGDRLESQSIRDGDAASWIGLAMLNEETWGLLPLGFDLYGGTLGVALFLAYLAEITRMERYESLARSAVAMTRRQLSNQFPTNEQGMIGAFNGWGGVVYALAHLGVLWNKPELFDEAETVVALLTPLIKKDRFLDIVGGSAGCIGGLIALHRSTGSERARTAVVLCAERLFETSRPAGAGIAWPGGDHTGRPLTGFSHGAAGIAWSLLEAYAVSGEPRFRHAALAGIGYERTVFLPELQNWPDFRAYSNTPEADGGSARSSIAWCHGAPGIGLSRLRSLEHVDDTVIRSEIRTALDTTIRSGFGLNHSLCHGDLGNLDLLIEAAVILDDHTLADRARRLGGAILRSIEQHGWLCGVPSSVETPGLMTGLAGIGYGLIRLAEPRRVPSLVSLAPPFLDGREN
jgi:type 2 lantibiotic biosynthesis protein LanM